MISLKSKKAVFNPNSTYKLKFISLNCCSLRSRSKRNQLAALLSDYDADLILGYESHIDYSFLSSEILPANYKLIRKD